MRSIETEAKYCRAGLDVCSVAVLHTMAAMLAEVIWVEAGLVVILQAVVNDSLSPAISLEDVRTTVRQLQAINANNLITTVVTYPPIFHFAMQVTSCNPA